MLLGGGGSGNQMEADMGQGEQGCRKQTIARSTVENLIKCLIFHTIDVLDKGVE